LLTHSVYQRYTAGWMHSCRLAFLKLASIVTSQTAAKCLSCNLHSLWLMTHHLFTASSSCRISAVATRRKHTATQRGKQHILKIYQIQVLLSWNISEPVRQCNYKNFIYWFPMMPRQQEERRASRDVQADWCCSAGRHEWRLCNDCCSLITAKTPTSSLICTYARLTALFQDYLGKPVPER